MRPGQQLSLAYTHPLYGNVTERVLIVAADEKHVVVRSLDGQHREAVLTATQLQSYRAVAHAEPGFFDLFRRLPKGA